jgi:excisionase family DNA binding protein
VLAHSPGRLYRSFIISYMFTYVNKTVSLFTRWNCIRKVYIVPSLRELERWMGTGRVADKLGYSRQYIIQLAKERKIRAVKTGAGWLYDPDSVAAFAASTKATSSG